jgi:hypothetical protein
MIGTVSGSTFSVQRNPLERLAQHVSNFGYGYTVHFDFKIATNSTFFKGHFYIIIPFLFDKQTDRQDAK